MSENAFVLLLRRALMLLLVLAPWPVLAQERPVDLLFLRPHLSSLPAGAELTYRLERTASDTARLGEPFSDDIRLVVRSVAAGGGRDIDLRIFTGDRAREVNAITDLTGNPVLVIFLDRAVSNMVRLTGGNAPYFKDRLRSALRDKAVSETIKTEFDGKPLDATRIVVKPFDEDVNAERMLGYQGSRFEFVVAESAPGMLLDMKSHFVSSLADAPKLDERIFLKSSSAQP